MEQYFKRENYCDQSAVKYQLATNPIVQAPNDSYKAVSYSVLVISFDFLLFFFFFFFFLFLFGGGGYLFCFVR